MLSLAKNGPDRSELAKTLWVNCAVPSILYGCEVLPICTTTVDEIERYQSHVGKFMLQIPLNSANVCSNIDAGLKPLKCIIAEKVLLYAHKTMRQSSEFWPKKAMEEQITMGNNSAYYRNLMKVKSSLNVFGCSESQIKTASHRSAIHYVLKEQARCSSTTFAMSKPGKMSRYKWFKTKPWVEDSLTVKIFNEFRSCNAGLGNRGPTKDGYFYKLCPLCRENGLIAINNEVHMVIDCPGLSQSRNMCSLGKFVNSMRRIFPTISSVKLYSLYMSDDRSEEISEKSYCLFSMKDAWEQQLRVIHFNGR